MPIPRKKSDQLLKGIIEENLPDLLAFLYPDLAPAIDFDRGIELLDKELHAIVPDRERRNDTREADLLFKVWLIDGQCRLILVNVEIEGGNDPLIERRVYEYNYRIRDRFGLPVATIVIYTGSGRQRRPFEYLETVLDTSIHFRYRAYHIFDHDTTQLLAMNNIFALVVAACQKSLLEGKIPEEELGESRLTIAKTLLAHGGYDNDRIISFLVFLKNYLFVDNQRISRNFDQIIHTVTENQINMGVMEVIRQWGREEGLEEKTEKTVRNLVKASILTDEQIAGALEVSVDYVARIRRELSE